MRSSSSALSTAPQSGNETQTRGGIGEDRSDACAALDLAVDTFEAVGGAQAGALAVRQVEDGEALGQIFLGSLGELWSLGFPGVQRLPQEPFGLGLVERIEDRAEAQGHGFVLVQTRDVSLGILLQMELAALPRHAGQGCPALSRRRTRPSGGDYRWRGGGRQKR